MSARLFGRSVSSAAVLVGLVPIATVVIRLTGICPTGHGWSLQPFFVSLADLANHHPALVFVLPALAVTAVVLAVSLAPERPPGVPWRGLLTAQRWFPVLLVLTVVAWRWPFLGEGQLNIDEGTDIAEAMALWDDPLFCRSIDTLTHGPLFIYPLLLGKVLLLEIDYGLHRVYGLLLACGTVVFVYLALARLFARSHASLAALPLAVFFAAAGVADVGEIRAANAEHGVLFLFAAAFWAATRAASPGGEAAQREGGRPRMDLLLAGLLAGAMPLVKPQGVLLAGCVVAFGLAMAWPGRRSLRHSWRAPAALLAGAALPSALLWLVVVGSGYASDFWHRFVLAQASYAERSHASLAGRALVTYRTFASFWQEQPWLWWPFVAVAALLLLLGAGAALRPPGGVNSCGERTSSAAAGGGPVVRRALGDRFPLEALATAFLTLSAASGALSIFMAGNLLPHYLLIPAVPAFALLGALYCGQACRSVGTVKGRMLQGLYASCAVVVPLAASSSAARNLPLPETYATNLSPGAVLLTQHGQPGDRLAVWGWSPHLYVQARMVPATKTHPIAAFAGLGPPDFYLRAFASELAKADPRFLFDAVVTGRHKYMHPAERCGFALFPELRELVASRYVLLARCLEGNLYVRRG